MSNLEHEKKHPEARDFGRESKENAEQDNAELKAAAAMERADFLSREVKSSQKQMQNIILHVQAVLAAIKQLRAQLELPEVGTTESVEEDKKRALALQVQIKNYQAELIAMREDLVREQTEELAKLQPGTARVELERLAEEKVTKLYAELGI